AAVGGRHLPVQPGRRRQLRPVRRGGGPGRGGVGGRPLSRRARPDGALRRRGRGVLGRGAGRAVTPDLAALAAALPDGAVLGPDDDLSVYGRPWRGADGRPAWVARPSDLEQMAEVGR